MENGKWKEERLKLAQALRLSGTEAVAFVGAGGKTTAMFQLARELQPPVVVTTTTHLGAWQTELADQHFIVSSDEDLNAIEDNRRGVILVTGPREGERFIALQLSHLTWLQAMCGYHSLPLLLEADGSRRKPLKAPAAHEPVIPGFVKTVVVVAGLSGLGQPLTDEHVFRPEIFRSLTRSPNHEVITPEILSDVLTHPDGGLKGIPAGARRVALLNQADTPELQAQAKTMADRLLDSYGSVVVASLKSQVVHATHEKIAGILLAAGVSSRFGRPKQLLDWHGQPFVRVVAQTALAAGLSPVVVVTGANAEQVEAALKGLPVIVVRNQDWESGQASSIKAGVSPLPASPIFPELQGKMGEVAEGRWGWPGGVIFLLADQPQVTVEVIRALVEHHAGTLYPVIAPYVFDQRANPVLFDRVTFEALMQLSGDQGGRGIFSKFSPRYLNWYDKRLLMDVDTPEDYERLLNA